MKTTKLFPYLFLLFFSLPILGQNSGRGFQFQAVARDANGNIRQNQQIELQFSLLSDPLATEPHWMESQTINTDAYGTFSVIIGNGVRNENSLYSSFNQVSFYQNFWLRVELRDEGNWLEIANQKLLSVPYAENVTPIGSIIPFAGRPEHVPSGWLPCNGLTLLRSDFPQLFAAIDSSWGAPNKYEFNLPDLRGLFLRGVAEGSDRDPDRASRTASKPGGNVGDNVGSIQNDQLRAHNHTFTYITSRNEASNGGTAGHKVSDSSETRSGTTNNNIGNETRPKNANVYYIIRAY